MSATDVQAELEARRDLVARLEQERTDLRIEIGAFQHAYLARLGPAQAELDALDLRVAEYRLRNEIVRLRGGALDAHKLEAEVMWQLRERHEWREQFAGYRDTAAAPFASALPDEPAARADVRAIYHDLAKRAHPDLAVDEADRAARGARMAEINAAYARSDLPALKALLAQISGSALSAPKAENISWLRAEIERLDQVIVSLRAEIAELNRSDWMVMKLDAALARPRGIDWFDHTQQHMEARIAERRAELDALIAEFRELVRQAGLDRPRLPPCAR